VIDCAGLQRVHDNLFEVLSNVSEELARSGADATIHVAGAGEPSKVYLATLLPQEIIVP